jgi:hypothetical protein
MFSSKNMESPDSVAESGEVALDRPRQLAEGRRRASDRCSPRDPVVGWFEIGPEGCNDELIERSPGV